ncbi:MAG: phage Gp37/Gp68 family protein [Clostridiales bacterium]|jgi:protein gp37|nr:phage Gp37/Gp68 family protein [Clostridiales bacterium]
MAMWNLWHGCHKISAGCENCYVYRTDAKYEKDSTIVKKTGNFNLPLKKNRAGGYQLSPGETVYTCFTSDFLLPDADEWRAEAWRMMRTRRDLMFLFITKRIDRLAQCLPPDWGDGYENVTVGCTCENQDRADFRLPIFLKAPIRHKIITCEPLLEKIDLSSYLSGEIAQLIVGGESGSFVRVCDYDWVLGLRAQCAAAGVPFHFKQTGANFRKDGKNFNIPRKLQHAQARKAGINLP